MRRKIAAGNWKMNGTRAALKELEALGAETSNAKAEIIICPPAPLLAQAAAAATPLGIAIGAQDCHAAASGAYTGDSAAEMIAETGAKFVIVGHSERRDGYAESDADVSAKAQAAWRAGITPIICLGETLEDREAERTLSVIEKQLSGSLPNGVDAHNTVVAYEPVWAIGTGKVPTVEQIAEVHDFMRNQLSTRFGDAIGAALPLLYGGSVKASNAATIFEAQNVDGALVGGASLQASDFAPIVTALSAS